MTVLDPSDVGTFDLVAALRDSRSWVAALGDEQPLRDLRRADRLAVAPEAEPRAPRQLRGARAGGDDAVLELQARRLRPVHRQHVGAGGR